MEFITQHTQGLSERDIDEVNYVAMCGFGGKSLERMRPDTVRHLEAAHTIQRVRFDDALQAFALYRPCLWRTSN